MKKIELDLTELESGLLETAIAAAVRAYSAPSPYGSVKTKVLRLKRKRALGCLLKKIRGN